MEEEIQRPRKIEEEPQKHVIHFVAELYYKEIQIKNLLKSLHKRKLLYQKNNIVNTLEMMIESTTTLRIITISK